MQRPLDLIQIEQSLDDKRMKINPIEGIERYIDYALANISNFPMSELCLPIYLVVEQLKEDYDQEEETLLSWEDMESIYDIIQAGLIQLGSDKVNTSNSKSISRSLQHHLNHWSVKRLLINGSEIDPSYN